VGCLAPYLYLVREAILGKLTRRDWDSMSCPWPFHIELQLIVEIVRATRAEHSRRFLSLNYVIKYVTTHLQEIPQKIR